MIVASNNRGKINEIKQILSDYDIYSLRDKNINCDVLEDGKTFYANALKKAVEIYRLTGEAVVADDSGLCITALDDFPGVYTQRYMGENASDEIRNTALINLANETMNRRAKVVCSIVYYDGENIISSEGVIYGKISKTRRGNNGFGFDEIFELSDGRTLAELSNEEKNLISARYLALIDLKEKLSQLVNKSK